jgi:hypothetical protein
MKEKLQYAYSKNKKVKVNFKWSWVLPNQLKIETHATLFFVPF